MHTRSISVKSQQKCLFLPSNPPILAGTSTLFRKRESPCFSTDINDYAVPAEHIGLGSVCTPQNILHVSIAILLYSTSLRSNYPAAMADCLTDYFVGNISVTCEWIVFSGEFHKWHNRFSMDYFITQIHGKLARCGGMLIYLLGYERVFLPLCNAADTPFYVQGDNMFYQGDELIH